MPKPITWVNVTHHLPTESLAGYLGRFAQDNFVESRRALLQELEIPHAIRISVADLHRLSQCVGVEFQLLAELAPSDSPAVPALRRSLTRTRGDAVCPQCLKAASYSRRLWSHLLAIACPEHGVHLIDTCPSCEDPLRHDRPLPHVCDCGHDLRIHTPSAAAPHEVAIALLLDGQVPDATTLPLDLSGGIPADIDLFLLGLANHFAPVTGGAVLERPGKAAMPRSVAAARERLQVLEKLLQPWPSAFERGVEALMGGSPREATVSVARRLGGWYGFLFRRFRHAAYEPFRRAAANCIVRLHDGPIDARTRNLQEVATVTKLWVPLAEAARELQVRPERLAAGIDDGVIEAIVHDEAAGYRQRFLSREEVERLQRVRTGYIDESAAAELLGVPRSVLDLMRSAGLVHVASAAELPPVTSGLIDRTCLEKMAADLLSAAPGLDDVDSQKYIALRELNLRKTTDRQRLLELYRLIGDGSFQAAGHDASARLGGLLFAREDVQARISSFSVQVQLNVQQISHLTGAHYDAVKGWIDTELLPATRSLDLQGRPWLVNLGDLVCFLLQFSPLAALASQLGASSRGLAGALAGRGALVMGNAERGGVVRISDLARGSSKQCAPDRDGGNRTPQAKWCM